MSVASPQTGQGGPSPTALPERFLTLDLLLSCGLADFAVAIFAAVSFGALNASAGIAIKDCPDKRNLIERDLVI
jgi:hypothetical protein